MVGEFFLLGLSWSYFTITAFTKEEEVMKNIVHHLVTTLTVCFLLFSIGSSFAQEEEEQHIYRVQTWRYVMPEGGSSAERDSLIKEFMEAQKTNDKILSQMHLRHVISRDSRDWVVITEYKSMADFAAAGPISRELNRKRWPDAKERGAFFQKLGRYFPNHSDEIFRELPSFRR